MTMVFGCIISSSQSSASMFTSADIPGARFMKLRRKLTLARASNVAALRDPSPDFFMMRGLAIFVART